MGGGGGGFVKLTCLHGLAAICVVEAAVMEFDIAILHKMLSRWIFTVILLRWVCSVTYITLNPKT